MVGAHVRSQNPKHLNPATTLNLTQAGRGTLLNSTSYTRDMFQRIANDVLPLSMPLPHLNPPETRSRTVRGRGGEPRRTPGHTAPTQRGLERSFSRGSAVDDWQEGFSERRVFLVPLRAGPVLCRPRFPSFCSTLFINLSLGD